MFIVLVDLLPFIVVVCKCAVLLSVILHWYSAHYEYFVLELIISLLQCTCICWHFHYWLD